MAVLHDELHRLMQELCTAPSVKAEWVRSILARHGKSLSEAEFQSVVQAIEVNPDSDSIDVDIEGLTQSFVVSSDDIEHALFEFEDKLDLRVEHAVSQVLENVCPSVLKTLYDDLPEALKERRSLQNHFEQRLQSRWKNGLDRLEMLIMIADEVGDIYVEDVRRDFAGQPASEESVLLDVLVALHCRACRTAREILCLLKSGYADGANARWRSLHEVAVIAQFILQHRGDTPQRYLDHASVERWRAALQYQEHCKMLGYEPFSDDEMTKLKKAGDAAVSKHGKPFSTDYGWAAQALGLQKPPTFRYIEASLNMSEWRPFYGLACQSVHAGSHGLHFSLAIPENAERLLHAGASDAGLFDPGQQTAISLTATTSALLTSQPNLDGCNC